MNRFTNRPTADDHPTRLTETPAAESPPQAPQSGLGWTIALSAWVIAFIVLVVYELWNFVFPIVRGWFR